MRCDDFLRLWNERLDAASSPPGRKGLSSERFDDQALESHSAACADCRQVAARFLTLERGLLTGYLPPRPSPTLEGRIVEAWHEELARPGQWNRIWLSLADLSWSRGKRFPITAMVIVSILGVVIGLSVPSIVIHHPKHQDAKADASGLTSNSIPTLNQALATASEATWQLARNASEPAASIGREFVATALPGPFPTTTVDAIVPNPSAASSALERIGGQVVQGARPLSSAARRAFSFLSLPSTEKHPGRRAIATPDKRA